MKVVHNNIKKAHTAIEWMEKAKEYETEGNLQDAASAYQKVIRADPANEFAYNRLMIIYRKEKEPEKELSVINKAIRAFENIYYTSDKKHETKVVSLSRSLMKLTGLSDKKGRSLYDPEPIGRWKKRKAMMEKKNRNSA